MSGSRDSGSFPVKVDGQLTVEDDTERVAATVAPSGVCPADGGADGGADASRVDASDDARADASSDADAGADADGGRDASDARAPTDRD